MHSTEKIGGRSPLLYLMSSDPEQARAQLDDAVTRCHGVRKAIAAEFGVHYVTLLRRLAAMGWALWFSERCTAARGPVAL